MNLDEEHRIFNPKNLYEYPGSFQMNYSSHINDFVYPYGVFVKQGDNGNSKSAIKELFLI